MKRKVKLIFQTWLQEIIIRTSLQDNKDRDKIADGFEAQFKKPVEYLTSADRCLKELNQKIMESLRKATSESSNNDGEQKAA